MTGYYLENQVHGVYILMQGTVHTVIFSPCSKLLRFMMVKNKYFGSQIISGLLKLTRKEP